MKGSISFCEVVQTFLIPRIEKALIRKCFYQPSEIAEFRQEAYWERYCLKHDPVVEDKKDEYDQEADFDPPHYYNNDSTKKDAPPMYPQRNPRIMWQSIAPKGSPTIMARKKSSARQIRKQSAYLESISSLAVSSSFAMMEMDIPPPPPPRSTEMLDDSLERDSGDHLDVDGDMEVETITGRSRKEVFFTEGETRGTNHPLFHRLTAKRQRNRAQGQQEQHNNGEEMSLNQNYVLSLISTYGLIHDNNTNNNTRLPVQSREAWIVALL
jgi:hypothetical protein